MITSSDCVTSCATRAWKSCNGPKRNCTSSLFTSLRVAAAAVVDVGEGVLVLQAKGVNRVAHEDAAGGVDLVHRQLHPVQRGLAVEHKIARLRGHTADLYGPSLRGGRPIVVIAATGGRQPQRQDGEAEERCHAQPAVAEKDAPPKWTRPGVSQWCHLVRVRHYSALSLQSTASLRQTVPCGGRDRASTSGGIGARNWGGRHPSQTGGMPLPHSQRGRLREDAVTPAAAEGGPRFGEGMDERALGERCS